MSSQIPLRSPRVMFRLLVIHEIPLFLSVVVVRIGVVGKAGLPGNRWGFVMSDVVVGSVVDVVAVVPHLLGFVPSESVVVVGVLGSRVVVSARVDVVDVLGAVDVCGLVGPLRLAGADVVLVVGFSEVDRAGVVRAVSGLADVLAGAGVVVATRLVVGAGRVESLVSGESWRLPSEVSVVEVSAIVAGSVVASSRAELVAVLDWVGGAGSGRAVGVGGGCCC